MTCMQKANIEIFELKLDDLVAVAQFSEAIFPTLSPIAKVKNSSEDTPWHTLIEADNYHALRSGGSGSSRFPK